MQTQWSMMRENSERIVRDQPAAVRDLDAQHLLDRPHVADAVDHGRHVVQPVAVRNDLVPVVGLRHLLEAAMEVADHRLGADDPLPVQARDEVDDAVRGGMRRPDRDRLRLEMIDLLVGLLGPLRHPEVFLGEEPALAGGVVLAQRVPHEGVVAQEAVEVRVSREGDPVQVEGLALEPVRGRPDCPRRWEPKETPLSASGNGMRTRTWLLRESECRWTTSSKRDARAAAAEVVHAAEVQKQVVLTAGVIPQKARQHRPVLRRHLDRREVALGHRRPARNRRVRDPIAQPLGRRREGGHLRDRHEGCSAANFAERLSRDFSPEAIFFWSWMIA